MPKASPTRILLARPRAARGIGTVSAAAADRGGREVVPAPAAGVAPGGGEVASPPDAAAARDGNAAPDIVIDLTGTPAVRGAGQSRDSAAPARVNALGGWRAVALVAAVAALAGTLAVVNYATGMRWRARALAAEERAAQAESAAAVLEQAAARAQARRAAAELAREAVAGQLAVSETDVAALEARLAALADDRAQAEDFGLRAAYAGPQARMRVLRAQASNCAAQVDALRTGMLVDDPGSGALREAAAAAQAACEQVGADAAVLAADG